MAYDLAVGMCACFADKNFGINCFIPLIGKIARVRIVMRLIIIKMGFCRLALKAMNKPLTLLPKGVVNDYLAVIYQPGYHSQFTTKNQGLQWPMPEPDLLKPKV